MNWYVVVFDLDRDQAPGIEPQIAIAQRVQQAYHALAQPKGFTVYHLAELESGHFSFFFSPVAAPHFAEFIRANAGKVWDDPLPDRAELTIGDRNIRPGIS